MSEIRLEKRSQESFLRYNDDTQIQSGTGAGTQKFTQKFTKVLLYKYMTHFLGGNGEGDTPDTFPNSEVKPLLADGTMHKSMGE